MSTHPSFEQIVRDHQQMVFRTLARMLGPRSSSGAQVEDLAQDVFLRLHRALPTFRGEALLSTFLYRITVNVAQTERKRRHRERTHVSISDDAASWEERIPHPAPTAAEQMLESEFAASVNQHLDLLSDAERTILILYHQEERSYLEIASILSMPLGTVRTHLHRARQKLRDALAANGRTL